MEASPGSSTLGPAPGHMIANPQATFTGPQRSSITNPSKGLQSQAPK